MADGETMETVTDLIFLGSKTTHSSVCSCLENPRDGGAWWAAVYGVTQGQTRLQQQQQQNHCRWWLLHEIKRWLLLGREAVTNLDSILKSRDITLPTKVHLAKAMVFPVVMYGCESWTIKKAEPGKINTFELWCWRRLLRVPWTARRSNQSILRKSVLNIHWKDWCWSWSINTLATCCKELTYWKRPWCWERWGWEEKGMTQN